MWRASGRGSCVPVEERVLHITLEPKWPRRRRFCHRQVASAEEAHHPKWCQKWWKSPQAMSKCLAPASTSVDRQK